MITVEEAIEKVLDHSFPCGILELPMADALGHVLAEDVSSSINMPPFRQSAVDGYAIHHKDIIDGATALNVVGEIQAGETAQFKLVKGEAFRIFTGAAVPDGATAVVMQELTERKGQTVIINRSEIPEDMNIRPLGEQIREGGLALRKGTLLTPAAIGFLQTLGLPRVQVCRKPKVSVITTGQELVTPGHPLQHGQVYESNSTMLQTALEASGFSPASVQRIPDDYDITRSTIAERAENSDVLILTGGISVGDYDFVGKALHELGSEEVFYKVRQKPGKPLYFGKLNETLVFALPGNPSASLLCFYIYVYPALMQRSERQSSQLARQKLILQNDYHRKGDRAQFLKAIAENGKVTLLTGQSSAMLHTAALANAFVYVPLEKENLTVGDTVEVVILPAY